MIAFYTTCQLLYSSKIQKGNFLFEYIHSIYYHCVIQDINQPVIVQKCVFIHSISKHIVCLTVIHPNVCNAFKEIRNSYLTAKVFKVDSPEMEQKEI